MRILVLGALLGVIGCSSEVMRGDNVLVNCYVPGSSDLIFNRKVDSVVRRSSSHTVVWMPLRSPADRSLADRIQGNKPIRQIDITGPQTCVIEYQVAP